MKKRLLQFLNQNTTLQPTDTTLLAVSGGIDSVVICYLFKKIGYPFAIAHCNFQLRGVESKEDERFVKSLATELNVPFHHISFNTNQLAKAQKLSIQEIARNLRYEWFSKTIKEFDYQYIATAHHLNDSIETVLYNLTKGCGIHGLHGILPQKGLLIRPLLFATKQEITELARKNNWSYREDSSNQLDKYSRNKIRHHIVPTLEQINPSFLHTFQQNISRFQEVETIYNQAITNYQSLLCHEENKWLYIDILKLGTLEAKTTILYEILKPYGFQNDIVAQIIQTLNGISGKQFYSKTHVALLDRTHLIVKPIQEIVQKSYSITQETNLLETPDYKLAISIKEGNKQLNYALHIGYFDLETLKFPLTLRQWKQGDMFQPFGMNGQHKKVSALLKDLKLSLFEKEKVWVLLSNNKICWVLNYRMDERFKITGKTKQILKIEVIKL